MPGRLSPHVVKARSRVRREVPTLIRSYSTHAQLVGTERTRLVTDVAEGRRSLVGTRKRVRASPAAANPPCQRPGCVAAARRARVEAAKKLCVKARLLEVLDEAHSGTRSGAHGVAPRSAAAARATLKRSRVGMRT